MKRLAWVLSALLVVAHAADALACSVCQGNRDSHLVKGAESGVVTLVLVTYALLLGFCGICAMWAVRARRLRIAQAANAADATDGSAIR